MSSNDRNACHSSDEIPIVHVLILLPFDVDRSLSTDKTANLINCDIGYLQFRPTCVSSWFYPYSNATFLSIGANSSVSKRVTILTYVCSENIGGFNTVTIEVNIFSVNKKILHGKCGRKVFRHLLLYQKSNSLAAPAHSFDF